MRTDIYRALVNAQDALRDLTANPASILAIEGCALLLTETYMNNGKVFICGNGGSHADAMHFAEELTGRFRSDRKPLGALALGDATHTTCVSNDYGFSKVFVRQFEALVRPEDLLIVLSTSGNSENILEVTNYALLNDIPVIALLGKDGGRLSKERCIDITIIAPGDTSDRIQELHMFILHLLVELVERSLFPDLYKK